MRPALILAAALVFGLPPSGLLEPVRAADGVHGVGHARNHDVYKRWLTPSGGSCCNNEDCRPTQARFDPALAAWQVLVDGVWCPVPESTRRPYPSPDGRAHVCAQKQANGYSPCGGIICFVPGAGG